MATNPFKQSPLSTPPTPNSSGSNSNSNSSNSSSSSSFRPVGQEQDYDDHPVLVFPTATTTTYSAAAGVSSSSNGDTAGNSILKQRATCACSNISIMQLFHEMKQKYPTVPDTVVSELVTQNCHDRPACIGKLEEAVLGTPAQTTYPAQSIHSGSLKRRSGQQQQEGNGFASGSTASTNSSSSSSSREGSVDGARFALQPLRGVSDIIGPGQGPSPLLRPTTLAVGASPPVPPLRPNRIAPQCPVPALMKPPAPELGETVNVQLNVTVSPGQQRHKSTISLQPKPPYSCELAQVTSTFNNCPPAAAGIVTAVSPPNASAGGPGGQRSSTSVNLTLRQPTDGRPHSPINIHASPLKYTAENFNAVSGIQSKLEVTFRDGFGSFSAMRAHVPGYSQQQQQQQQQRMPPPPPPPDAVPHHQQHRMPQPPQITRRGMSVEVSGGPERNSFWQQPPSSSSGQPGSPLSASRFLSSRDTLAALMRGDRPATAAENDGLAKQLRHQNFIVAELAVSQQLEQKQRLEKEVEEKRMQFERICREIYVLQKPLRSIDAELLDREVLLLSAEVELLQKAVDSCDDEEEAALAAVAASNSGPVISDGLRALGDDSGSPMFPPATTSAVFNRPPRPPRPPPPRVAGQSPCPSVAGSLTPGTPHGSLGHGGFPPGYPGVSSASSSSSSPCSTSSSFTSNGGGGGGPSSNQHHPATSTLNQPWTCSLCTFQNHELLPACEVCSLPKASGTRSLVTNGAVGAGAPRPADDGGDVGGLGAMLRRQHLSVDAGVAAAAAAAAAVVGASVGPSTAPPAYPGTDLAAVPPAFIVATPVGSSAPPSTTSAQQSQQQQQHQPSPPPLQNAQYQKSSIEC
ncbi:uncharacterized protein LOC131205328 [Anopheles bellator]|uniref:uncharacterized protein LOC131205328 n=1 Tax=Anopheles bellator TaxID=139047 RepID=UPI0026472BC0|nr:uncharacterized protein LOC131205328 [Anopheles bellator]